MGNVCSCGGPKRVSKDYTPTHEQSNADNTQGNNATDVSQTQNGDITITLAPTSSKTIVKALFDFESVHDDALSFAKGELMEIDGGLPEAVDWIEARSLTTNRSGYVPCNYVVLHDTSPQSQDWWFDHGNKEASKALLQPGTIPGTFLVRYASDKIAYALSIRDEKKATGDPGVRHYKIHMMDDDKGVYINPKKTFSNLFEIVSHYKDSDGLCCKLTVPFSSVAPVIPFKEIEINRSNIKLSTKLGAGFFGEVWKGMYLRVVDVAVKTLKTGTMSSEEFLKEAEIMHHLRHRKLVQILGVVSSEEPFYIITELMVNGALLEYLRADEGKSLNLEILIDMNSQIAEGMSYLEGVNYIHRDLRAANILVGQNNEVKVADFGLARMLDEDEEIYAANPTGKFPIKWTAPEAANERIFTVKSDVWSFGVLMFEIITFGKTPYAGMKNWEVLQLLEKGKRMDKPSNRLFSVPNYYYELMLKCWHQKPEERPTFMSLYDLLNNYSVNEESSYKEIDP